MINALRRYTQRHRWTAAAIAALGYSLMIAGASIGGMNSTPEQAAGLPVLLLGISLVLLGTLWLLARAFRTRAWASETSRGTISEFRRTEGPGQLPRPGDISEVIYHATKNIDPELFYSEAQLQEYIQINPGALRVLRNDSTSPTRLTGYYILLGLSPRAEELIRNGAIDAGVAVAPSLTVPDPGKTLALYLGMIQGFGKTGKDAAIISLIEHVWGIVGEQGGRSVRIYARRGHESSTLLMDRLGFKPVLHPGGIEFTEAPSQGMVELHSDRRDRLPADNVFTSLDSTLEIQ